MQENFTFDFIQRSGVTFVLNLKRRTYYYAFNFIFPCFMISILCIMGFLLPGESGEKLVLGKKSFSEFTYINLFNFQQLLLNLIIC
jgi:hypothetical protein